MKGNTLKNSKKKSSNSSLEVSEEFVYKVYDDNTLIHFDVTVAKEDDWFTLISGLPEYSEIKNIETLERIILCLQAAKKRWESLK